MAIKKDIKKPFRIIGVQIFDGTSASVHRILTPGWYPLIKCKEDIGTTESFPVVDDDVCPLNFYQRKDVSMPTVSISAIVGKNGSGKTSLVDIIYRILNNFAETLLTPQGQEHCEEVMHASGLYVRLFFELDGVLKFIQCRNEETTYFEVENDHPSKVEIKGLKDNKVKEILNGFFYTISINYSLYAFNPADYESEFQNLNDTKWIDCLFHKNDGYFVPIVLTPFRENGQINVNNENDLAEQRLSTLSLLFHSQRKEFLDDYEPWQLKYSFNSNYIAEKQNALYKYPFIQGFEEIQLILIQYLQSAWEKILADEVNLDSKNQYNKEVALFYLAYKSLKICTLYSDYYDLIPFEKINNMREPVFESTEEGQDRIQKDKNGEIITKISTSEVKIWAKENTDVFTSIVRKLLESLTNHITAKIHQTIEYLKTSRYKNDSGIILVNDIINNKKYENYDEVMLLLPPPFVKTELQFKKAKRENEYVSFRNMSSGERQMYYSLSSVFYHIRNIAGIKENGKRTVSYHHINLIFDEAELYYHPEYQRKFVSKLLSGIELCHINKKIIRSINIIIITHSPFILSDIPDTNILFLGMNQKKENKTKTLGANIYDMLKGGFFLEYAIGDYIQEKLHSYLEIYYMEPQKREEEFQKVKDEMKYVINHLGEEYLYKTFLQMYEEIDMQNKNKDDIKAQIEELKRQQAVLEAKLKEE